MSVAFYIAADLVLLTLLVLRWLVKKWDRDHPGSGFVRVVDAMTGRPLPGADVRILCPVFVRANHKTNESGFARIGYFGVTQRSVRVEIAVEGYEPQVLRPTLREMRVALMPLAPEAA